MGTYMGAYSINSSDYQTEESAYKIIVKEAECLGYYHYHGSMGEWTWRITDSKGWSVKLDTWYDYENKSLRGKTIIVENGNFVLGENCKCTEN